MAGKGIPRESAKGRKHERGIWRVRVPPSHMSFRELCTLSFRALYTLSFRALYTLSLRELCTLSFRAKSRNLLLNLLRERLCSLSLQISTIKSSRSSQSVQKTVRLYIQLNIEQLGPRANPRAAGYGSECQVRVQKRRGRCRGHGRAKVPLSQASSQAHGSAGASPSLPSPPVLVQFSGNLEPRWS